MDLQLPLSWRWRPRQLVQLILRILTALLALLLVLLLAFLTYSLFYWWYIPPMQHVSPVYFQYGGMPWARIPLAAGILRDPIQYDISLELEVPDQQGLSERIGMFMIGWKAEGLLGEERPCLLRYRSELVRAAELTLTLPLLLVGWRQETFTQRIFLAQQVPLPPNLNAINLSLSRPDVPIREARLHIVANLNGLRYLMYYWRWTMALFMTMFFFASYLLIIAVFAFIAYTVYQSRLCDFDDTASTADEGLSDESESFIPTCHKEDNEVPDISSESSGSTFISRTDSLLNGNGVRHRTGHCLE